VADNVGVLGYAVRMRVVAKYVGQLALVLAGLMAVPLALALVDGQSVFALRFAAVCVVLVLLGAPLARIVVSAQIQANEALVITAAGYLLAALALAFPFGAAGLAWQDALFEAVSGVTTTGLTTLADVEHQPRVFLFARAWSQWYGGLGIVVLSVALLLGNHVAARRLVDPEGAGENLAATMRLHARRVLTIYVVLTLAGFVALLLSGEATFDAVAHALSAVSTGGFSTHNASIAGLPSGVARSAVLAVALLCAVSLPLYYRAWASGWRCLIEDPELRALLIAVVLVTLALWWCLPMAGQTAAPEQRFAQAAWFAVSAQTTTGYATLPVSELGPTAKLVMLFAMSVGGSIGSTAGGVKLLRLILLLRLVQLLVQRSALTPHAVAELRFGGRVVGSEELARALLLILLFLVAACLSWLPFVALGHAPLDALFEIVSALGTVGLSSGISGPALEPVLKLVLIADMLLGRVEFVALLVLFYPRTWIGKRATS